MPAKPPQSAPTPRFDPDRRIGPTLWDGDSRHYRLERMSVAVRGSSRRYRLWMAFPRTAPPAGGHPLACLLDGNAVADTLTLAHLEALAATGDAPALLAIGPDSDLRFDVAMRAYDYTPAVRHGGPTWDDEALGRAGGGADAFLDFIAAQAIPAVARHATLDARRYTLWGHSYGGLFALHALLRRPQLFTRYAAADPSLWWQDGFILREAAQPAPLPVRRETTLLLMQGASAVGESPAASPPVHADAARVERLRRQRASVPPQAGRHLVARLGHAGVRAEYLDFAGIPHGPMLAASLPAALALAARPSDILADSQACCMPDDWEPPRTLHDRGRTDCLPKELAVAPC